MKRRTFRNIFVFDLYITLVLFSEAHSRIPTGMRLKIDNLISKFMKFNNMPGLGLAIVKNHTEVLYTTGYGFRNIEEGLPFNEGTTFAIGSVTKSFTAIVVVRALHENFPELGEAALDIPIRKLAPTYNFTLSDMYRSESATFRDLLAHRTCLQPQFLGLNVIPFESTAELVYRQRYAPEACQFRTDFIYNNDMIVAASEVIAHIANSTFEKMLQNLLTDIGMTDSTWIKDSDDHNSMPGRSAPYYQEEGQFKKMNPDLLKVVTADMAAGGILSTARDMAKHLQFHLNHGKVGDVQVVPEEVMKWMYRASNLNDGGSLRSLENDKYAKDYAYALCLFLATYNGWQFVYHDGYISSYQSKLTLAPELKFCIFTSTNGPGVAADKLSTQILHNSIFEILRGRDTTLSSLKRQRRSPEKQPKSGVYPTSARNQHLKVEQSDIIGSFGGGLSGQIVGSLRKNADGVLQPYISYGRFGQAWLTQISNSSFQIKWDSDVF